VGGGSKNRVTLIYVRYKGLVYKHTHILYIFANISKKLCINYQLDALIIIYS